MTILFLTFLLIAVPILGCGDLPSWLPLSEKPRSPPQRIEVTPGQFVTLDGHDATTGIIVLKIALWKERDNRAAGISATAGHGDGVKFITRDGDVILVETGDGKRGWVTSFFIKEIK